MSDAMIALAALAGIVLGFPIAVVAMFAWTELLLTLLERAKRALSKRREVRDAA